MTLHYPKFRDTQTIALNALQNVSLAMATDEQFRKAEDHRKRYPNETQVTGKIEKPGRTLDNYQEEIEKLGDNLQRLHEELYFATQRMERIIAALGEDRKTGKK